MNLFYLEGGVLGNYTDIGSDIHNIHDFADEVLDPIRVQDVFDATNVERVRLVAKAFSSTSSYHFGGCSVGVVNPGRFGRRSEREGARARGTLELEEREDVSLCLVGERNKFERVWRDRAGHEHIVADGESIRRIRETGFAGDNKPTVRVAAVGGHRHHVKLTRGSDGRNDFGLLAAFRDDVDLNVLTVVESLTGVERRAEFPGEVSVGVPFGRGKDGGKRVVNFTLFATS